MRTATRFSCLGLLLLAIANVAIGQDADSKADNTIPIAASFMPLKAKLPIDGKEITVEMLYAHEGSNVYVLPVWHLQGPVTRLVGEKRSSCSPTDLLHVSASTGPQSMEMTLVDLLNTEHREKIREAIRAEIKANDPSQAKIRFLTPQIDPNKYRVVLVAPGGVEVATETELRPGEDFVARLNPNAITAWQKNRSKNLTLADAKIRVVGSVRVRLQKLQFIGSVTLLEDAADGLRKQLSSSAPKSSHAPDYIVTPPNRGNVTSTNAIISSLRQSLQLTISARNDAQAKQMIDLLQRSLESIVRQQELRGLDDGKRLTVLMENQVALSGTVGEIKSLAKMNATDRTTKLKEIQDDWNARRAGKSSSYNGAVSASGWGVRGGVAGGASDATNDETELGKKREKESLERGVEQLSQHFVGKLPSLSGISFDQSELRSRFTKIDQEFRSSTFETGYIQQSWDVPLTGYLEISPEMLLRQYALLKTEYELLLQQIGTAEKLGKLRQDIVELQQTSKDAAKLGDQLKDRAKNFDAEAKKALQGIDQSAIIDLAKKVQRLQRVTGQVRAADAAAFKNVEKGDYPPLLDCTKGVDAATAKAAQLAWARAEGTPVKKRIYLDHDRQVSMEFACIPPGVFLMGEKGKKQSQREVQIRRCNYVGMLHVTQKQWRAVMGSNPSLSKDDYLPVENVSWLDCRKFSEEVSKRTGQNVRLLTEAEWEYSCRAGTITDYYFGDDQTLLAKYAWFSENSNKSAHQVGDLLPNAWDLFDMNGNIYQWCENPYADNYKTDSVGPGALRGGSWSDGSSACRSASRIMSRPGAIDARVLSRTGLRLLLSPR